MRKHQVIASVTASHLRLREWRTVGTVEPGPCWGKDPKEAFWWCRDVFTKKLRPNGWKCKGRRKEGTYRKTSGRDLPTTSKQPSWTRTWSNRMKGPRWWSTFKDSGGNEGNNPEGHLLRSIEGRVWLQEICYTVGRLEGWGFAGNGDWSWGESKKTLRMKLLLVVSEPLLWNEGEESIGQRKKVTGMVMTYRDDMFITGEEAEVEGILREVQRSGRPKRPADGSDESQKRRRRREGAKGHPSRFYS